MRGDSGWRTRGIRALGCADRKRDRGETARGAKRRLPHKRPELLSRSRAVSAAVARGPRSAMTRFAAEAAVHASFVSCVTALRTPNEQDEPDGPLTIIVNIAPP